MAAAKILLVVSQRHCNAACMIVPDCTLMRMQDCKLNAVEEMVRCFSSMLESTVRGGREDELVSTMSGLLQGSSMPGVTHSCMCHHALTDCMLANECHASDVPVVPILDRISSILVPVTRLHKQCLCQSWAALILTRHLPQTCSLQSMDGRISIATLLLTDIPILRVLGKDWLMDSEVGSASPETGLACLAMLAVDSLLGVVSALEGLTDRALDGQESGTPSATSSDSLRAASEAACVAMVTATWSLVLPALSLLLGKASGEVLVLKLLRVGVHLLLAVFHGPRSSA